MKEYTDKQLLQMSKTELLEKYRELEASINVVTEAVSPDPIQETSINVELLAEQIAEALRKSNAEAMRKVGSF